MKNLLTAFLPALALLALGGCASTAGLATSEDDGVYYSSKDRTTALVREAPAQEPSPSANEAANPDYNGNTASAPARQSSGGSDEYYDNTYTYMRGVPDYGVTNYVPYSPYTSISYGVGPFGYGGGYGNFYDPFYSPFYSPFGFGYGSGISISLGFGRPWGYGGYGGYGFGRPGFGSYGGGFYDPYYYSSPFYGGYYGRGGYYGNNFGYGNNYGYGYGNNNNRYYGNENVRGRTSGHRNSRVSDGRYSSGNATGSGSNPGVVNGNSRVRTDGMAPTNPNEQLATPAPGNTRVRNEGVSGTQRTEGYNQPRRQSRVSEQPVYRTMEQPEVGTRTTRDGYNAGRRQSVEPGTPQGEPTQTERTATQPEGQRRRGGFFQSPSTQPTNTNTQAAEQPRQQRAYEQPRQQQRQQTYQQPRQQSYERPQQQQRSEPSYSSPSNNGGGNSGGGNSGGGGRSRGRGE